MKIVGLGLKVKNYFIVAATTDLNHVLLDAIISLHTSSPMLATLNCLYDFHSEIC